MKACYLDDSDDKEFDGYSDGEIKTAEKRCHKELKRCHRQLRKMESGELVQDDEEEEETNDKSMCLYFCKSN